MYEDTKLDSECQDMIEQMKDIIIEEENVKIKMKRNVLFPPNSYVVFNSKNIPMVASSCFDDDDNLVDKADFD